MTMMSKQSATYHPYIDEYMSMVESGRIKSCKEQKLLMKYVRKILSRDDIYFNAKAAEDSINVPAKYFPFELFLWQKFLNALMYGVRFKKDDRIVFDEVLILMGRGGGKTGYMAYDSFYMMTGHHGINNYDIDVVATSEDQAKRTFTDVYNVINTPSFKEKFKKIFKWTLEEIQHKKTNSVMNYNTSNSRTKDGKRTGCVIFDEAHEYENYDNINVYTSGQGKVRGSRIIYTTTDGHVRGGPLDDLKETAKLILSGEIEDIHFLPFICKLDSEDEVDDPANWEKANPSLPYNDELKIKMKREYQKMQRNSKLRVEFMTKRMNIPISNILETVCTWDELERTNQSIPDLSGLECIGAVDFAQVRDFCGMGLLFKKDNKRYWLHHSFINQVALDIQDINMDVIREAEAKELCTIIRTEKSIDPHRVKNWFLEMAKKYRIKKICMDSHRASVLGPVLEEAGFEVEIVRRGHITHSKLSPLVDDLFINGKLVFGDDLLMRWYVWNTFKDNKNNGNIEYAKIDPEKRKTDGFHAFLHALNLDSELKESNALTKENVRKIFRSFNV
ncbi:terminase TerL endonuclease subunit [Bacillus sp. CH_70]|uniref:terminase TerL endonuclease subunit n=1 Tax=Bacillus sp. CH_70 TaxID=2978215 RepID=UPI0030F8298F